MTSFSPPPGLTASSSDDSGGISESKSQARARRRHVAALRAATRVLQAEVQSQARLSTDEILAQFCILRSEVLEAVQARGHHKEENSISMGVAAEIDASKVHYMEVATEKDMPETKEKVFQIEDDCPGPPAPTQAEPEAEAATAEEQPRPRPTLPAELVGPAADEKPEVRPSPPALSQAGPEAETAAVEEPLFLSARVVPLELAVEAEQRWIPREKARHVWDLVYHSLPGCLASRISQTMHCDGLLISLQHLDGCLVEPRRATWRRFTMRLTGHACSTASWWWRTGILSRS